MLLALASPMVMLLYDLRLSLNLELVCHTRSVLTQSLVQCLGLGFADQIRQLKGLARSSDLAGRLDPHPTNSLALCSMVFRNSIDTPQ